MSFGNSNGSSNRRSLGKRDRQIISDVVRYRMTTNEIVRTQYLPDAVPNAVSKITSRLVDGGWLTRHSLYDNRDYFTPGKRLCGQFGLPISRCRPLGTQSLASHLSVSAYCIRANPQYRLLDEANFATTWFWIPEKLRTLPCVVESSSQETALRLVRVDLGGTPAHVAMKCHRDMNVRCNVAGFPKLLAERRLVLVVLTSTESKKELLVSALRKGDWPVNTRLEVFVVPELCYLIST